GPSRLAPARARTPVYSRPAARPPSVPRRRRMNETRTLARFVAETKLTDLPRRLIENLKITVLQTFGTRLVGTRQPWAQRIVATVKALGGVPEASVVHGGWRTDGSP